MFKVTLQIGLALAFFLGGFIFASRRTFGNLLTSCMQRLRKNSGGDSAKKATARHLRMTLVLHPWAEIRLRRETRWKRCLAEHVLLVSVLSQPGNLLSSLPYAQVGVLVSNLYSASAGSAEGAAPTFKKRNVRQAVRFRLVTGHF